MRRKTALWLFAIIATAAASFVQSGCRRSSDAPAPTEGAVPAAAPAPDGTAPAAAARAPEAAAPAEQPAPAREAGGAAPAPPTSLRQDSPLPSAGSNAPAAAPAPQPEAPAPAPPPPPRKFTLRQGTPLAVFTSSTLSTKANKSGESFSGVLAKAIVDGDWVIAKQGAKVEGLIVESDPGGRVKGVASMTLTLRRLTLSDGRIIDLNTDAFIQEAKSTKGKDAKKVGIGAGVGAAIGAIAGGGSGAAVGAAVGGGAGAAATLATRGDAAEVAGETELKFTVQTPVSITENK
jgi:hypothetical protein